MFADIPSYRHADRDAQGKFKGQDGCIRVVLSTLRCL